MKGTRILIGIVGVVVIAALLAPASLAQNCTTAKRFASVGGGTNEKWIWIDPAGLQNTTDHKRFWEKGAPSNISTATTGCAYVPCCSNWWDSTGSMIPTGFNGVLNDLSNGVDCDLPVCPPVPSTLIFVGEEETADGTDAGFIVYEIDQISADSRQWNLARTVSVATGSGNAATHTMHRYPIVDTQSSSGAPPNTTVTNDYANVEINYHGVTGGTNDIALAGTSAIVNVQILGHQGAGDPGRDRTLWNLGVVNTITYGATDITGDLISGLCDSNSDEVYLAVGLEFVDGMVSDLVGASTAVECDPNIAEPETPRFKRYRRGLQERRGR